MKRIITSALAALWLISRLYAQNPSSNAVRQTAAVLHFDAQGLPFEPAQMGAMARLELDKLNLYEVMDRYDVAYLLEREQLKIENCYGKICLVETGRKLKVEKMLTGSAELLGERIVITMRFIDVNSGSIERTQVVEFLNLKQQLQAMMSVTMQKMFGLPLNEALFNKLTRPDDYESSVNVPDVGKLRLGGPRMGMTVFSGKQARILRLPEKEGGLDASPVMFQFGYQFEKAYLNQGRLQTLFEFIPILTGLDQGVILPSVSILHGVRDNRSGFEIAFGPTINVAYQAEGVEMGDKLILLSDWRAANPDQPDPPNVVKRFDRRGSPTLGSSFVFAAGKSFKSGRMNIPVNVFYVPGRDGQRFGISVGFNGRG